MGGDGCPEKAAGIEDRPTRVRSYRDLIAWQKAMALAERVYRVTESFPKTEVYGLASQMRRAAVSVPSNLAEGHGRNSTGEMLQFLGHARGSLAELDTQMELAARLGYVSANDAADFNAADEVGRIINGLRRSLKPAH